MFTTSGTYPWSLSLHVSLHLFAWFRYACNVSENYQRCLYEDYHQSCQHLINTCLNSPRYRCWSTQMLMIDISTLLNWLKIYNSVDKIVCPRGRGRFSPMTSPRTLRRNVVIYVRKFRLDRSGPRWCSTFISPLLFWCVFVCVGGYYHLDKMSSIFTVPKVLLPLA